VKPLYLTLAAFQLVAAASAASPPREPNSADYRELSWVENRAARLIERLSLTPEQTERVRAILTMEYELALRDRAELAKKTNDRSRKPRGSQDGDFHDEGMNGRGERGMASGGRRGMPPGAGRINAALVERARQRYQAGDEKLLNVLTDHQKSTFSETFPSRNDRTDDEIMLAETLDLNDTQIDRIKPILAARKSKMDTIMAVGGDRQTLFHAMREAAKDFDNRIRAELNQDQKKVFRKLCSRMEARSDNGPPGGGRGRRGFNR